MKTILLVQTNYPNFLEKFYKDIDLSKENYKSLKSKWAKQLFGSSNFYLKGLKGLGWSGDEVIANDVNLQSIWAKEHKTKVPQKERLFLKYIPQRIKNYLKLNSSLKDVVFDQIKFHKPDVLYIHDVTFFSSEELKRFKNYAKLIVGQIAYPMPLDKSVFYSYDLITSSLPNFVKEFKQMGVKSEYLKWCFEKSVLDSVKPEKRIYDVTYIGGVSPLHSKGNKVLEYVSSQIKVNIWGYGKHFLPPTSSIRKNFHTEEAWGKDMFKIFAQSKIVINRHINISKNYANNMRLFEATGMGALLLTDKKINNNEFFEIDKEIVVYTSPQDLVKKIRYYLKNPKQMKTVAQAGQKRTLKDHTYNQRMKDLDIILRKYLDKN